MGSSIVQPLRAILLCAESWNPGYPRSRSTQKAERVGRKRGNPGLRGRLVNKSIDTYVLSLETINKMSVKYRIEAFAYLICNAWELLLKARLLDLSRDRSTIYRPADRRARVQKTISLRESLIRVYPSDKDPIRRNIEFVADLRDDATHLTIGPVPKDVLALFQASVLDYHKELNSWFEISLSDRVPVGMMTIVYDLTPDHFDLGAPILRKQMDKATFEYLSRLQSEIVSEREHLGNAPEFAIVFDYKLGLARRPQGADIVLTQGEGGVPLGMVNVPKSPDHTHPYFQQELIDRVNELIGGAITINQWDIQCISAQHNARNRPEFSYRSTKGAARPQFSEDFALWIVESYRRDSDFFTKARSYVSARRSGGSHKQLH
jgi:hypothetical protein